MRILVASSPATALPLDRLIRSGHAVDVATPGGATPSPDPRNLALLPGAERARQLGIVAGVEGMRRPNPWAEVFDPGRFKPTTSAKEYVTQGANVATQIVTGLIRSEGHHPDRLCPDEGAVMTVHGQKVAAYRDETGFLHTLNPACRHMGCIVEWDPAEKAWACPCHGSRYRAGDKVIHGPAMYSLKKKERDWDEGTVTVSTPDGAFSCEGPWTAGTCSSARQSEPCLSPWPSPWPRAPRARLPR